MNTELCNRIFQESIELYHQADDVDTPIVNPYPAGTIEALLFHKNWIDTVQWHLEDIVRDPAIDPIKALEIKRRIDKSNQERTDMVEYVDGWVLQQYKDVASLPGATANTETPAWAIDRLSILALKIYHMGIEAARPDASEAHLQACGDKLAILLQQRIDLSAAIDALLNDIASGKKFMKLYKQMKMYNDESLNLSHARPLFGGFRGRNGSP